MLISKPGKLRGQCLVALHGLVCSCSRASIVLHLYLIINFIGTHCMLKANALMVCFIDASMNKKLWCPFTRCSVNTFLLSFSM